MSVILILIGLILSGCSHTIDSVVAELPTATPTLELASISLPVQQQIIQPPATATPTNTATPTITPSPTLNATPETTTCEACEIEHVIIISIDGLRPDALTLADTPNLDALIAAGAYSDRARAVLPSVTLINHASMLGGMRPEKHGITWNVKDSELGKINGPTLFSVAHEAGLSTAMVVGKPKLEHLVLPDSIDDYYYAGYLDQQVMEQVITLVQTKMPDLLFIHLPDVDSAGHLTGWMSPGQLLAISYTDGQIGKLITALENRAYLNGTLLIITSDHGGTGVMHGGDLPEEMTIPWLAVGPGIRAGFMLEGDIIIYDTAATALRAFDLPIPEIWDGQPVLEIFD